MFLREMAESKSKILRKLNDKSQPILDHLIRQFVLNSFNAAKGHWVKEIYSILSDVPKWTETNKYLSTSVMYHELFGIIEDIFEEQSYHFVEHALLDEVDEEEIPEYYDNINITNLFNYCKDYFTWLAESFSRRGFVNISEVRDKINELIQKYLG